MKRKRQPQSKSPVGRDAPRMVGFYAPKRIYDAARLVLSNAGLTVSEYLTQCLEEKSREAASLTRFVSESQLVKHESIPSRTTLVKMRVEGKLDGLFEQRGNKRIVYDLNRTLAFFAGRASTRGHDSEVSS